MDMGMGDSLVVRALSAAEMRAGVADLTDVLIDCVAGGASVSFMDPLDPAKATSFWDRVADRVESGAVLMFAALSGARMVGTVYIVLDQPENQPHRADLCKMLVHRSARRRGLGAALLRAAEQGARAAGKTLLVLDTAGEEAERLYEREGWVRVGRIPDYALMPDGAPAATTYFYKRIA